MVRAESECQAISGSRRASPTRTVDSLAVRPLQQRDEILPADAQALPERRGDDVGLPAELGQRLEQSGRAPGGRSSDRAPPPRPGRCGGQAEEAARSRRPGLPLELGEARRAQRRRLQNRTMRSISASPPSTRGTKPASRHARRAARIRPAAVRSANAGSTTGSGARRAMAERLERQPRSLGWPRWSASKLRQAPGCRRLRNVVSLIQKPPSCREPAARPSDAAAASGGMPSRIGSSADGDAGRAPLSSACEPLRRRRGGEPARPGRAARGGEGRAPARRRWS